MTGKIYLPKQIVPLKPTVESPLFFLAGPIRGGGDWQVHRLSRNHARLSVHAKEL